MIKHTLTYLIAYAMPGILGFISFGAYTRFLTPAEYAIYSVGVSVAFLIGNVCFGWIRFSIGRFQAELPASNFISFALACIAATTLVATPFLLTGAFTLVSASKAAILGVLVMTFAQALFDITQEIRRARHQSMAFTKASVSRSLLGVGLSVSAAAFFHLGAALLFSTAVGFLALGLAFLVENRAFLRRRELDAALISRFITYGMPLALSGLVFSGNSTLARVLVTDTLGAAAGGQYGAGLDLTGQLTNMIAGSVCSIMGPAAFHAYGTRGSEAARHELERGLGLFLGILAPTIAGLMIVAVPLADIASGREFQGVVGKLLPILALSRGLNVFCQFYLHLGFQIVEKPLRQVVCGGTTLAANLVLNLILTRLYGLDGAAVALLLADICGVIVSFALLRPVFPMPFPPATVLRILAATIVMAVVCRAEQLLYVGPKLSELALAIASGAVAYAARALMFDIAGARTLFAAQGYRTLVKLIR